MIKQFIVDKLHDPYTHEPLFVSHRSLLAPKTGSHYDIIHDIPILLSEHDVIGLNKKYQKFYDKVGSFTGSVFWLITSLFKLDLISKRKELLADLSIKNNDTVLETSIGAGANIPALNSKANYVGIDISMGMLKACQRYKNVAPYNLQLIQANAENLPFKDNVFDVVFHVGGINFFNNIKRSIDEMIRVAKPGAQILICDETQLHVDTFYKKIPFVKSYFKDANPVVIPQKLIPSAMINVQTRLAWDSSMYVISFSKPS